MARTITITDNLYSRLESLARPFVDKEAADVITWLVNKEAEKNVQPRPKSTERSSINAANINARTPRERGAIISLDGSTIHADSVPDLCSQVMEYLYSKGHWSQVLELSPYKTSSIRFLFSKTPKHPNGNDFFVPVKYRGLYMEAHKNYKTTLEQLSRFLRKCDVTMTYLGT
jgi:predicted CopG family antitoxin